MNVKVIKRSSNKNKAGLPLTGGGSRRIKILHRSVMLGIATSLFNQIISYKNIIKNSNEPEPLRKKLAIKGRDMLETIINDFQNRDEFMALPEVKAVYRSMKYRLTKNKSTKEKYKNDEAFREQQKAKMQKWRADKANAEREKVASKKRRRKAASWKRFLKGGKPML